MRWNLEAVIDIIENKNTEIQLKDFNFILPVFILSVLCLNYWWSLKIKCNCNKESIDNYLNRLWVYDILKVPSKSIRNYSRVSFMEVTEINNRLSDTRIEEFRDKLLDNVWIRTVKKDEAKAYSVNFFLAELIRNVTNHASVDDMKGKGFFMFQTYPASGKINISIVDSWVGITESFKNSSYWDSSKSTRYYIDLAFERWKTSNSEIWAWNGLFFCRELVRITDSSMTLVTGDTLYSISWNTEIYTQIKNSWNGVIIDLELNINNINTEKVSKLFWVYPWYIEKYEELDELFT